jgi:hypothetical protein
MQITTKFGAYKRTLPSAISTETLSQIQQDLPTLKETFFPGKKIKIKIKPSNNGHKLIVAKNGNESGPPKIKEAKIFGYLWAKLTEAYFI